jgi:serine/threonine protein kinase
MIARLHSFGFVHRDIKPSNFLIRPRSNSPLCLTDFGLARSYLDPATGEHVRQNGKGGFTGTLKYASPNAHKGIELTRRDDLMSWFYSVLEVHLGKLPWDGISDRHEALVAKEAADAAELCEGLPPNFVRIFEYIKHLGFSDEPDYEFLLGLIGDPDELDLSEWDALLDRAPSNVDLVPRTTAQLVGSSTCKYNKKGILGERIGNLAPTARLLPDDHTDEPVFCCCWSFRAVHV